MPNELNVHFLQLITSLAAACMQQLGKLANPMSGKVERDLDQAMYTIELLRALREKTDGNLADEELTILDNAIFEAQMNYLDETKKSADDAKTDEKADEKSEDKTEETSKENADAAPEKEESPD